VNIASASTHWHMTSRKGPTPTRLERWIAFFTFVPSTVSKKDTNYRTCKQTA
jgi:hypothetical protein